jgi:hypothetical protein
MEIGRAKAALNLVALFAPMPSGPIAPPQLRELAGSLFRDDPPLPVRVPRSVLPTQTQRLLDATGYTAPTDFTLHGGMFADPLLPHLMTRSLDRFNTRLLPPAGTPASDVDLETNGRAGLAMHTRDAVLCYFANYPVSRTRKRPGRPGEKDSLANLRPPEAHDAHKIVPLAYQSIDDLTRIRVYNDLVYEFTGNVYLPTHLRFGDAHPDANFYLCALVSYWLMANPPYLVPLPGQTPESASPLPATEMTHQIVQAAVAQNKASNAAGGGAGAKNDALAAAVMREIDDGVFTGLGGEDAWALALGAGGGGAGQQYSHSRTADGSLTLRSTGGKPAAGEGTSETPRAAAGDKGGAAADGGPRAGAGGARAAAVEAAAEPLRSDLPTPGPHEYIHPTLELSEAVLVFLTMNMCDGNFHEVVDGSGGTVPRTGGKRIIDLALRTAEQDGWGTDAYLDPAAQREIEWELQRCASLANGIGRVTPEKLRADIPGMVQLPEVFARIHAPMFHYFRNHLTRASMDASLLSFIAVVDTWVAFLTPWRARPRYKNQLPSHDKLRESRAFSYNQQASRVLQQKVDQVRVDPEIVDTVWGCLRRRRPRTVVIAEDAGQPPSVAAANATLPGSTYYVDNFGADELLRQIRGQGDYNNLSTSVHDFEGNFVRSMWEGNPEDPEAPQAVFTSEAPLEVRLPATGGKRDMWCSQVRTKGSHPLTFPSHFSHSFPSLPVQKWLSWIRVHYLFYTFLLHIVLDRFRHASFATDPREGRALLECLERLLDLFEPGVVRELQRCDEQWDKLFVTTPLSAAERARQSQEREAELLAATRAYIEPNPADREVLAIRLQLLAHRNLLKLPPDVSPRSMLRPFSACMRLGEDVIRALQSSIDSKNVKKPGPIEIPDACRIEWRDSKGKLVVVERPPFWERTERFLAGWLTVLTFPAAWLVTLFLAASKLGDWLRHYEGANTRSVALPIKEQYARLRERISERWSLSFASYPVSLIEGIATFVVDAAITVRNLLYALVGIEPGEAVREDLRPGSDAERIFVAMDRLRRLVNPALSLADLPRPAFFVLKKHAVVPLAVILRDRMAQFLRWLSLASPAAAPVRDLLEPRVPRKFLQDKELDDSARAALVLGRGRLDNFQTAASGARADAPPGTWESRLLLRITAFLSAALRVPVNATRMAVVGGLAAIGFADDPVEDALPANYLRWIADTRALTALVLFITVMRYVGLLGALGTTVVAYFLARFFLLHG